MDQPRPWVHLNSGELSAQIDPLGAQLSVLQDRAGHDLLWDGDPAVWAGRAPLLFPIVGALAGGSYRLGSKTYCLSRHGFARGKVFSIRATAASSAVFTLAADAATFQVYPFRFELEVHFELIGPALSLTTHIRNRGDGDMPASFGYHPAFRWPLPFGRRRDSHFIEFETDEPDPVRRIDAAGLLKPEPVPTPVVQRRLALTDTLFESDVLIFDRLKSRSVIYGSHDGPRIQVGFPDAPYLGLWSKPTAHFVCIEPWHGVTDPQGFAGDFRDKPGVFVLAAGETRSTRITVTLL